MHGPRVAMFFSVFVVNRLLVKVPVKWTVNPAWAVGFLDPVFQEPHATPKKHSPMEQNTAQTPNPKPQTLTMIRVGTTDSKRRVA